MPGSLLLRRASLRPLFAAAEEVVPGMSGALGGHEEGFITCGTPNRITVERLVTAIAARHPEAGRGYWTLRSWNMLVWQPVFLAVLSVHRFAMLPRIKPMSQRVAEAGVMGFRLPDETVARGEVDDLICFAGQQVRELADTLLADLSAVIPMKAILAQRLLADRILGVLARLSRSRPDCRISVAQDRADAWLAAASLEGQSGLIEIELPDGRRQLALDRRACCLEYRVAGADYCPSCPKLDQETRRARLLAHYQAHV